MKILFVDDSKTMLKINAKTVKKVVPDFEKFTAMDGTEALKIASTETFDVILLDLVLPDMTGLDILAKLNEMGCQSVVGFISSMGTEENQKKALELGAKFFLDKPVTPAKVEKIFKETGVM